MNDNSSDQNISPDSSANPSGNSRFRRIRKIEAVGIGIIVLVFALAVLIFFKPGIGGDITSGLAVELGLLPAKPQMVVTYAPSLDGSVYTISATGTPSVVQVYGKETPVLAYIPTATKNYYLLYDSQTGTSNIISGVSTTTNNAKAANITTIVPTFITDSDTFKDQLTFSTTTNTFAYVSFPPAKNISVATSTGTLTVFSPASAGGNARETEFGTGSNPQVVGFGPLVVARTNTGDLDTLLAEQTFSSATSTLNELRTQTSTSTLVITPLPNIIVPALGNAPFAISNAGTLLVAYNAKDKSIDTYSLGLPFPKKLKSYPVTQAPSYLTFKDNDPVSVQTSSSTFVFTDVVTNVHLLTIAHTNMLPAFSFIFEP
jgi:hypothetical protein